MGRTGRAFEEAWVDQWIHLLPEAVRRLDELAAQSQRSRAELLRESIHTYLDRLERQEVAPPDRYRGDMSAGRYQIPSPIPREDAIRATRLARELKVSKASLYREAVRVYLAEHGMEMEA